MGRLQLLSISVALLCGSVVMTDLSVKQKELERAAELAVERAAEKAAERAVEKALNSGNSSTITVTVKESYSNAMKTAEEQAAPGSESTRPYDPKIYDRQYGYSPPVPGGYKVDASAEAEELGISKESLNSSVENAGASSAESVDNADRSVESATVSATPELNFESGKSTAIPGGLDKPATSSIASVGFDASTSALGFDAGDFSTSLDDVSSVVVAGTEPGFKGDFGLKNTQTFSTSYSKAKDEDFSGTKIVDVDDDEDAEIFKMYSDFAEGGWKSAKQKGWVRHRPLWDDSKSRVSREHFWEDFSDISAGETQTKDSAKVPPDAQSQSPSSSKKTSQVVKRMVEHRSDQNENQEQEQRQVAVPLATLSLDPKTPAALYQLLQREVQFPMNGYNGKVPVPMKVYVTIPVPYLPSYGIQKKNRDKPKDAEPNRYELAVPPIPTHGSQKSNYDQSKETESNRYDIPVPYRPLYSIPKNEYDESKETEPNRYEIPVSHRPSFGSQKSSYDQSGETETNPYQLSGSSKQFNNLMNDEPVTATAESIKRSFEFDKDDAPAQIFFKFNTEPATTTTEAIKRSFELDKEDSPPHIFFIKTNDQSVTATTESIKRSFELDKDLPAINILKMNDEGAIEATKPIKRSIELEKEDSPAQSNSNSTIIGVKRTFEIDRDGSPTQTNSSSTIIVVPDPEKKDEVPIEQQFPFLIKTPLKLFDPKRPETEIPQMAA